MKPARDTTTHSKDEIIRRLSYLLYLATAVGGFGLLLAAAVKKSFAFAALGIVVVALNLVLHRLGRRRFRFEDFKRGVGSNPFKQADGGDRERGDRRD